MDNLRVLITGASSGIGRETALLLCREGFEVWGTSRRLDRLPRQARFHPLEMDLNQLTSIRSAFEQMQAEAGGIDVLINNAGESVLGPIERMPTDAVARQFETLVFGPIELVRLATPIMRGQGRGWIVNVTSLAAQLAVPYLGVYSAAKAALASASECLSIEVAGSGIRVVDVQPGDIATAMTPAILSKAELGDFGAAVDHMRELTEHAMANAPAPIVVAHAIVNAIRAEQPPSLVVPGSFFQRRIATLGARLLPRRMVLSLLARYYGLEAAAAR